MQNGRLHPFPVKMRSAASFFVAPAKDGEPTIIDALKLWSRAWSPDWPPVNEVRDAATLAEHPRINWLLARAFRHLGALETADDRLRWLESETLSRDDYALAPDPYRATLMRWWLQIFAWVYPDRAAQYSRTGQGSSSH